MPSHDGLSKAFYDHCLGAANPAPFVESTGGLERAWVEGYLALLDQASQAWGEEPMCPLEVLEAIQAASFRLTARYENWHRWTTGVNAETEHLLAQVRTASDKFLRARLARQTDSE